MFVMNSFLRKTSEILTPLSQPASGLLEGGSTCHRSSPHDIPVDNF